MLIWKDLHEWLWSVLLIFVLELNKWRNHSRNDTDSTRSRRSLFSIPTSNKRPKLGNLSIKPCKTKVQSLTISSSDSFAPRCWAHPPRNAAMLLKVSQEVLNQLTETLFRTWLIPNIFLSYLFLPHSLSNALSDYFILHRSKASRCDYYLRDESTFNHCHRPRRRCFGQAA